jgi:hypothetical protein
VRATVATATSDPGGAAPGMRGGRAAPEVLAVPDTDTAAGPRPPGGRVPAVEGAPTVAGAAAP